MTNNMNNAKQALEAKLRGLTQSKGWRDNIAIANNADPLDTTQWALELEMTTGGSIGTRLFFARFELRSTGSIGKSTAYVSSARSRFHPSGLWRRRGQPSVSAARNRPTVPTAASKTIWTTDSPRRRKSVSRPGGRRRAARLPATAARPAKSPLIAGPPASQL
jgi:hypothetical protein